MGIALLQQMGFLTLSLVPASLFQSIKGISKEFVSRSVIPDAAVEVSN